jgi:hypothetical protein
MPARRIIGVLKPKEIEYMKLRLRGMNSARAEEICGVSKGCRLKYIKDEVLTKAFDDFVEDYANAIRNAVPTQKLAQLIADGCEALDEEGNPDWRARRFYIQMAAEHSRRIDGSKSSGINSTPTKAPSLNINIVSVGDRKDNFDPSDRQPVLRGSSKGGGRALASRGESGIVIDADTEG